MGSEGLSFCSRSLITNHALWDEDPPEDAETTHVAVFECDHRKREALLSYVIGWILSSESQLLTYQNSQKRLRVMQAGE